VPGEIDLSRAKLESANRAWSAGFDSAPDDGVRFEMIARTYEALAKLGDVFVFADVHGAKRAKWMSDVKLEVAAIMAEPAKRWYIGRYAAIWLDETRDHQGVLLVGNVGPRQVAGDWQEVRLKLATKDPREIVVVTRSDSPEPFPQGGTILLLGTIVSNPRENLAGYNGGEDQVVVPGSVTPLPAE
jgi:hypothetical protein